MVNLDSRSLLSSLSVAISLFFMVTCDLVSRNYLSNPETTSSWRFSAYSSSRFCVTWCSCSWYCSFSFLSLNCSFWPLTSLACSDPMAACLSHCDFCLVASICARSLAISMSCFVRSERAVISMVNCSFSRMESWSFWWTSETCLRWNSSFRSSSCWSWFTLICNSMLTLRSVSPFLNS